MLREIFDNESRVDCKAFKGVDFDVFNDLGWGILTGMPSSIFREVIAGTISQSYYQKKKDVVEVVDHYSATDVLSRISNIYQIYICDSRDNSPTAKQ